MAVVGRPHCNAEERVITKRSRLQQHAGRIVAMLGARRHGQRGIDAASILVPERQQCMAVSSGLRVARLARLRDAAERIGRLGDIAPAGQGQIGKAGAYFRIPVQALHCVQFLRAHAIKQRLHPTHFRRSVMHGVHQTGFFYDAHGVDWNRNPIKSLSQLKTWPRHFQQLQQPKRAVFSEKIVVEVNRLQLPQVGNQAIGFGY